MKLPNIPGGNKGLFMYGCFLLAMIALYALFLRQLAGNKSGGAVLSVVPDPEDAEA